MRRPRGVAFGLMLAAVVIAMPWLASSFQLTQLSRAMFLALGVMSLTLLTGTAGQISLGQAAFVGTGAYTTAILGTDHGWPLPAAIVGAVGVSFVAGVTVGAPASRVKGASLALVTLAVGVAFPSLVKRFDTFTGGSTGKKAPSVRPPTWTGLTPQDKEVWIYAISVVVLIVGAIVYTLASRSGLGRQFRAIRESDMLAEAIGVNLSLHKSMAFGLSAALAGLAGALFSVQTGFVSPDSFGLTQSVELLAAFVLGGATIIGALIGGAYLQFVPYWTADLAGGHLASALSGVLLILVVIIRTNGPINISRLFSPIARARAARGRHRTVPTSPVSSTRATTGDTP